MQTFDQGAIASGTGLEPGGAGAIAGTPHSYIACAASLAATLNVLFWFPGIMTRDSFRQFAEARSGQLTDWHPPVMAWLWSFTLPLNPSSGAPFLLLNCILYWFAIALIAAELLRLGHRRAAVAVGLIAAAPPFVVMNAFVWKDTLMAVCLLAAFAALFHVKSGARHRVVGHVFAAVMITLAVLARSNAIIAAAPLIVYAVGARLAWWRQIALGLAVMVAGTVAHGLVNAKVLGAERSRSYNSLKVYDVAGTAWFSRDRSAYPVRPSLGLIDRCYDTQQWDWIGRGECRGQLSLAVKGVRPWLDSISTQPVAYLQHRIAHFNEEMFFWVPFRAFEYRETDTNPLAFTIIRPALQQEGVRAHGWMASFPLFSPALFLIAALGGILVAWRRLALDDVLGRTGAFLCGSSALYAGSFFLIGVANMWRYEFYPMLATSIGVVMIATVHARQELAWGALERAVVLPLAAAAGVITLARLIL